MIAWQHEPLGPWNRPVTENRGSRWRFKAPWENTLGLVCSEIEKLDVRGTVALRIDVQRGDIRRDGMLRANAKVGFPGVVVSFQSKFGPLSYATDEYDHWQANVRAIALSLQALRAVDRYGVSRSGEQYQGWRAIESGRPAAFATVDEAVRWLREATGITDVAVPTDRLLRLMSAKLHPDRNGDAAAWDRLDQARQIIKAQP